jgi:hypothetical protein
MACLTAGPLWADSHRAGQRAEGFADQQAGHRDLLAAKPVTDQLALAPRATCLKTVSNRQRSRVGLEEGILAGRR